MSDQALARCPLHLAVVYPPRCGDCDAVAEQLRAQVVPVVSQRDEVLPWPKVRAVDDWNDDE